MSFDHLAPHYRWMEHVLAGRVLQRARVAHLAALDHAKRVLLVGEGPGRFLAVLRARQPDLPITVVDASPAMLDAARRSVPSGPTEFVAADVRTWLPPQGAFDGIVTSCVLDCFGPSTLRRVVPRLADAAGASAAWLHIDFAVPGHGWRRVRARVIHRLMYFSFRLCTGIEAAAVTAPDPWLRAAGFVRKKVSTFSAGLLVSELWQRGLERAESTLPIDLVAMSQ